MKQKTKSLPVGRQGFTLMEVIISMGLIVTALVTCIALVTFSISSARSGKSKLIAVNLAQEGLEIVRNIRDSNWLAQKRTADTWRDGLGEGDWWVQYDSLGLLASGSDNLLIDDDGFYQYASGSYTPFRRTITITHIDGNRIKVEAEINWQERGKSYSYKVEDRLYNWLLEE
jgi:type II secretory pathway pseudopilin PulG